MRRDNESFAETLNFFAKKYIKENDYIRRNSYQEDLELFELILESFEIFGSFLDCIPIDDRYEIIQSRRKVYKNGKTEITEGKDGLLKLMLNYSGRSMSVELSKIYPGVDRPQRKVNKHLSIIKNFEDLIADVLSKAEEGEYYIPYEDELVTALEVVEALKDDLENKKFNIFSRTNYYAWELQTKTPLNNFLQDLIDYYKIDNYAIDKKQLIDNF